MDSLLEREFLECIEKYEKIVTRKGKTRECKNARTNAWDEIKKEFEERTGKLLSVVQLQKKWNNIQSRLKEKMRSSQQTGGGPAVIFSENDALAQKILGEGNLKLVRVPGARDNTLPIPNTNDDEEEASYNDNESSAANCSTYSSADFTIIEDEPCQKKGTRNSPNPKHQRDNKRYKTFTRRHQFVA